MRIDLKVLVDLPTLSNRFLFYRTPTQQKNVFIFRVHMDCLPTKTILCHKIRVQFQKIEILEFVLSPQWNWIRNQCLKKVPNERNLNHTVFAVPTGALGRPPSGVQSRRTPSPQRSEWLVRPSRGEEGTWQLTSSSPHTQHCTKQCLTCTDACSSRTATPVWEPRCEWVAQSFAGRGREGWGWGRAAWLQGPSLDRAEVWWQWTSWWGFGTRAFFEENLFIVHPYILQLSFLRLMFVSCFY